VHILIADDEPQICSFLSELLSDEGYMVSVAENGAEALEQLLANPPDLLITDNMMPRLSGLGLIARLRSVSMLTLPIILMSAIPPLPLPAPPIVFIAKPFDLDHLLTLIATLLASR
jgi:DNA-binding response OmpR family regulator